MTRAIKLRPILFLLILLAGLVPLAISTGVLIEPNRDLLRTQEQTDLTRMAEALSRDVNLELAQTRQQLELLGLALLALPQESQEGDLLAQEWVYQYLETFARRYPEWLRFAVLNEVGQGPLLTSLAPTEELTDQGRAAFEEAVTNGRPAYRFLQMESGEPAVVVLVPVADGAERRIFLEAVVRPRRLVADLSASAEAGEGNTFLIDRSGALIWSRSAPRSPHLEQRRLPGGSGEVGRLGAGAQLRPSTPAPDRDLRRGIGRQAAAGHRHRQPHR